MVLVPLGVGRYDWGLSTPSPSLPSAMQGRMALGPESYVAPSPARDAALRRFGARCVLQLSRPPLRTHVSFQMSILNLPVGPLNHLAATRTRHHRKRIDLSFRMALWFVCIGATVQKL